MKIIASDMTASKKRKIFICVLMLFMFAGIAAGTILVLADTGRDYIAKPVFSQNLIKNGNSSFWSLFCDSFFSIELILVCQMLCGFFAAGQPICVFTLFHRGAAGGISSALIYENYGARGIIIILIMLLPVLLFNMYIMVLGARESVKFSNIICGYVLGSRIENKTDIKLYFLKFSVLSLFALLCSVLDSMLTYLFSGLLR